MGKKIFSIKNLLSFCAVLCLSLAAAFITPVQQETAQADDGNTFISNIDRVEDFSQNDAVVVYLTNTDYMTATEWDNTNYKWVSSLDIANKTENNVCNAILDKNLSAYNYEDYIFIDGKPLKEFNYHLEANKFQRVDSLGITIDPGMMANVQEIVFKEGCTIPTLHYSYFGEAEYSAIQLEEGLVFAKRDGAFVKKYPFDGYEAGVKYDACERYLYPKLNATAFNGYPDVSLDFTGALAGYGWDDEGYSLASSAETEEGKFVVYDFVNPIDAKEFGIINLRFYTNIERTLVAYNAYEAKPGDLGPVLEMHTSNAASFTTVKLLSSLYADENGMIDRLVFQFTNGHTNEEGEKQQFFLASFTLGKNTLNTEVYDDSFFMQDKEDCYDLTFRFNKQGEFTGEESLDTSKVLINGVSIDEINAEGDYATAEWNAIQGIYQINARISKEYQGAGQIKNADLSYVGNCMTVEEGLVFPSGEVLNCTYNCRIYVGEKYVDYELFNNYKETSAKELTWKIDTGAADNVHMYLKFDEFLVTQEYNHADQPEAWRAAELPRYGRYDAEFSKVYVAGGFKASLFENIIINGKTIGEWHATDNYTTAIFVHYGQTFSDALDLSIDSNSRTYQELLPLFEEGEGVTVEVKQGLKFMTGVRVERDYKFILTADGFVLEGAKTNVSVFYDGKAVNDGDRIVSTTEALEANVEVDGVKDYALTMTRAENVVKFVIAMTNGETITFTVEEKIVNEVPVNKGGAGCNASVASAPMMIAGLGVLLSTIPTMLRRKKDEE